MGLVRCRNGMIWSYSMVGAQDKPSQCSSHRTESEIEVGNVVAVDLPQYSNIEGTEEPFRLNMVICAHWESLLQLMNVIIRQESLYSPSALCLKCDWQAIWYLGRVSIVNTGGKLPELTLSNGRERSQADTLPLALRKNSDTITLLQEGSLLTLAVLLSRLL